MSRLRKMLECELSQGQEVFPAQVKCNCTNFVCAEECACRQMSDQFTKCTIQEKALEKRGSLENYAFRLHPADGWEIYEKLAEVKIVQV
ncbi:hypothetical protein KIN20_032531 [Parelaphostrongylus tenuis]|uniref:Uncharacterized protein n=1 Tax=Parelaphostrongylus tenuis TaxID=148309 RepID=A0AAD5WHS5_PARTN|nr:hypothetical protein KIN20_032531 [Parelaphostrongylus tenuis]